MTKDNNLVRRLRDWEMWDEGDINDTREEAADRIEELQSQLSWVIQERDDTFARMLQRAEEAEAKLAKTVDALQSVINACDQGRMIPRPGHGAGGMTIEANVKGSIYTGVPAWPIEEARTALLELNGDKP